ncbi:hypothetical protein FRB96_002524 [Tulasnella sp. 330]|nr:hypothetical protein FRB96_002524 [Tulasnella sp. 330]KAG8876950.1 hypothetical protein FRB97_003794 [Tulasnella sp. 331]KAG8885732.1 hypothetical protein FRB98_001644 [Tulasnella sp. 332]
MDPLPAEILIAIINALTSHTQPSAYTYSSEVKATLKNLGLVNCAFHKWSSGLLYRRVTVSDDQIAKLQATLSPCTPRAISLAKRIHSLRLHVAKAESNAGIDYPSTSMFKVEHVVQATALLQILSPTTTLQRLFVEMALTVETLDLQNAIGSFTTLSELVLGNGEDRTRPSFWMIELARRPYSCLTTLQSLTILDLNICHHSDMHIVFPKLTSLEELVIIRPWGLGRMEESGRIFAKLFTPPRSLKRLVIILASGWKDWPIQFLNVEAFGPAMIPHAEQVLILPEDESLEPLMSWETIRGMIGAGHKWEMAKNTYITQMATLPAEISIAIVNALTFDTKSSAYTYASEVKATLRNLGLVNSAFYEWSNGLLYQRVTVSHDQITMLRATLSPSTPRAISLAKRIRSLRLHVAKVHSHVYTEEPTSVEEHIVQASTLLRILAPNTTLKRVFVDLVLTDNTIDLQNAVGSCSTLSELVLGSLEEGAGSFWIHELAQGQYNSLRTLRSLTILDVNITYFPELHVVLPQLKSVEELTIIRPWGPGNLEESGRIFAELFTPPQSLKRLSIILASGWGVRPLQRLTVEAFGPAMIPYFGQFFISPEGDVQKPLMSWETIRDMIGAGHQLETGLE